MRKIALLALGGNVLALSACGSGGSSHADASTQRDAGALDAAQIGRADSGAPLLTADASADAGQCTAEVCNGRDDDCDGKTDEGLLEVSSQTQAWTVSPPLTGKDERGLATVVPSPQGAVLLFKPLRGSDSASPLRGAALDASNTQVGTTQTGLLPSSRGFIAASDGHYLAALFQQPDANGNPNDHGGTTRLKLWTLSPSGQLSDLPGGEVEVLHGPADLSDLAVSEGPRGRARILLAYADSANGVGSAPAAVQAFTYNPNTSAPTLMALAPATTLPDARPTVHIVKQPCREGWLVTSFTLGTGTPEIDTRQIQMRAANLAGKVDLASAPLWTLTGHSLQGMAVAEQCTETSSPLLVTVARTPDAKNAEVDGYELTLDNQTGTVTASASTELAPGWAWTKSARYGGVWYVVARGGTGEPTGLFELDVPGQRSRRIALPIAPGFLSYENPNDVNLYFVPTSGIVATESSLLFTFGNGRPWESPYGNQTVAVSYLLACPSRALRHRR